jgi:hypothetical protein
MNDVGLIQQRAAVRLDLEGVRLRPRQTKPARGLRGSGR